MKFLKVGNFHPYFVTQKGHILTILLKCYNNYQKVSTIQALRHSDNMLT